MNPRARHGVMTAAVIGLGAVAWSAGAQPVARMTVHLVNYAGVPPDELRDAEREAAEIYAAAGIELEWVLGNKEDHPSAGRDVRVVLLDDAMSSKKIIEGRLSEDVLGVGSQSAWAYIFVTRVALHSIMARAPFPRALGRVVAHEIGHLVLPIHSHTRTGIMQAAVNLLPRGDRYFTHTQTETLLNILTAGN